MLLSVSKAEGILDLKKVFSALRLAALKNHDLALKNLQDPWPVKV